MVHVRRNIMSKVGDMIQEGREKSGLSMRQLADMASVSHSDISRVESGEREVPSPKFLRKISRYIGVNYNDLMYAAGDRIDVNGDYEPNNCRWVTHTVQANNRRNNTFYEIDGIKHTLAEWAKLYNLKYKSLYKQIKYNNRNLSEFIQL